MIEGSVAGSVRNGMFVAVMDMLLETPRRARQMGRIYFLANGIAASIGNFYYILSKITTPSTTTMNPQSDQTKLNDNSLWKSSLVEIQHMLDTSPDMQIKSQARNIP